CLPAAWFVVSIVLTVVLVALLIRGRTRAAKATEAKFRSLLDAAPDPMVIMNGDGVVILVNARAEQLFKAPRERLVGRPVDDLLCQEGWRADLAQSTRGSFDSSTPTATPEPQLHVRCKDGTRVPVEIRFSPLQTAEGNLTISILRDITDRIKIDVLRN